MSDGWTDMKGRHLINFLVNSPEGTYFLESVDASGEEHDAHMLADLLEKRIEGIGKDKVVQIITDKGLLGVLLVYVLHHPAVSEIGVPLNM